MNLPPHPFPLPLGGGEGARRAGEGGGWFMATIRVQNRRSGLPMNGAGVAQPSLAADSAGILARRTLGRQGCRPNRQAGSLPYDRTVHQYAASFWEWRANERGRSNSLTE